MSVQDKFDAALQIIQEHNEAIGDKAGEETAPGFINGDEFIICLKATGATSEDRLRSLSHEDILECLPSVTLGKTVVKPRLLAKAIAAVFRGKEEMVVSNEKRPLSAKTVDRMTLRELVEHFDPEDHTNKVGEALAKIANGRRFVVFDQGRNVNIEKTIKILNELKQGYPEVQTVDVDGTPRQVYRLGSLPDFLVDENPCFPGRPLRPDGTCDQTGRSWEGISQEARQIVRLAMELGEISASINEVHNVMDLILSKGVKALRQRYRRASVDYDRLAASDTLPRLKIALKVDEVKKKDSVNPGPAAAAIGKVPNQSPLDGGHKVRWPTKKITRDMTYQPEVWTTYHFSDKDNQWYGTR